MNHATRLFADRLLSFGADEARLWGRLSQDIGHGGADPIIAAMTLARGAIVKCRRFPAHERSLGKPGLIDRSCGSTAGPASCSVQRHSFRCQPKQRGRAMTPPNGFFARIFHGPFIGQPFSEIALVHRFAAQGFEDFLRLGEGEFRR